MAKSGSFTVSVALEDNVTKPLRALNKRIAAANAPFNRLSAEVQKFGKLTGITKAAENLGRLAATATKTTLAVAGISSIASVAGVYELAKSFATAGENLINMSHGLGQSADSLLQMQNAARLTGVSADTLNGGLMNLSDTLQDAVGGRNINALRTFEMLGINIRKSAYEAKSAQEVLPQLADAIAKLDDKPALQRNLARQFGVEGLLPYLRKGAEGIREYNAEVEQFNRINGAGIAASDRLYKGFTKLTEAGEGFGYAISQVLEPVLTPFLTALSGAVGKLSEWIRANQTLIDQKLTQWLQPILTGLDHFSAWIQKADFDKIAGQVSHFGKELKLIGEIALGVWATQQVASLIPLIRLLALIPGSGVTTAGLAAAGIGAIAITGAGIGGGNSGAFRAGKGHVYKDETPPVDNPPAGAFPYNARTGAVDDLLQKLGIEGRPTSNPNDVMGAFQKLGYDRKSAAGITANLQAESGLDPFKPGDSGTAYGIGQWHADRQKTYESVFNHTMQSVTDRAQALREQMAFVDYELHHGESNALAQLNKATNPYEAGAAISKYYERPAAVDEAAINRGAMAMKLDPYSEVPASSNTGKVGVDVTFANAPPGTKATATASGPMLPDAPRVNLGHNNFPIP